jgi:aldose sugar dehydrogenase
MRPRTCASLLAAAALTLSACSDGDPDPTDGPEGATQQTGGQPEEVDRTGGTGTDGPDQGAAGTAAEDEAAGTSTAAAPAPDPEPVEPTLDVQVVMDGLTLPWDVQLLPDGTALVSERGGRLLAHDEGGTREVALDLPAFFTGSEAGLMGLAVSPDVARDGTVFACYATQSGGSPQDVRVVRLVLDDTVSTAQVQDALVTGIPVTSGRHAGCRLLLHEGVLLVGTGDAADPDTPQDLTSLGGKVLAVTPEGEPADGAPFVDGADPLVLTYGHRNVQGLAAHPDTGQVYEVEHGPDVDDEVNLLIAGANYGWDPGPRYDERVPMTDTDAFPDAVEALWSSGDPTHATSGAVVLSGEQWGAWDGALAVAELRGAGVTVLTLDETGATVTGEARIPELEDSYGRLRSLTLDPGGDLWVTTSNGTGDMVLRVSPQAGP